MHRSATRVPVLFALTMVVVSCGGAPPPATAEPAQPAPMAEASTVETTAPQGTATPAGKTECPEAPNFAATIKEHKMIQAKELKWEDAPPGLPKGAKVAVLEGDPGSANGIYTMRAKLPANYKVMPHWHTSDEQITVISGTLYMGHGETLDPKAGKSIAAGGFATMPSKMAHSVWTKGPVTIQMHGVGPFDINYYKPEDDPRNAPPPAEKGKPGEKPADMKAGEKPADKPGDKDKTPPAAGGTPSGAQPPAGGTPPGQGGANPAPGKPK